MRLVRYCLISILIAVAPWAKAQMVGGTISGDVVDPAGSAVAQAEVLIRNDETGSERKFVTAEGGTFSAPSVAVGVYTVSVSRDGFAPLSRTGIALTVGQNVQLHLTLTVGSVQQSVSVVDTPAVVDTSTLQTQGLVDERQVKELPLNGRSFDQLIQLNPASVSYTTQRSGGVGTSNSSVGNMYSVSGRRPQDNLFLLNGIEYTGASLINVTPGGTSGQLLGVDAVREFNVLSDTYGANYGKRTGAQVSIITASGGNKLHGSVYEFLRNSALDARNYFDQAQIPEFQRNDFGAALGGPCATTSYLDLVTTKVTASISVLARSALFRTMHRVRLLPPTSGRCSRYGRWPTVLSCSTQMAPQAASQRLLPIRRSMFARILVRRGLMPTSRRTICSSASTRWMTVTPILPRKTPTRPSTSGCASRW